jgi:negative regulator of flagellin synthesis FlgM
MMKIGHPAEKPAPAAASSSAPAAHGNATASTAIPAQADASAKIELSSTASTLLSGGASSDFDADKVARISKSIDEGTFKINPEAIADKLIANAQDVLSNVHR